MFPASSEFRLHQPEEVRDGVSDRQAVALDIIEEFAEPSDCRAGVVAHAETRRAPEALPAPARGMRRLRRRIGGSGFAGCANSAGLPPIVLLCP